MTSTPDAGPSMTFVVQEFRLAAGGVSHWRDFAETDLLARADALAQTLSEDYSTPHQVIQRTVLEDVVVRYNAYGKRTDHAVEKGSRDD